MSENTYSQYCNAKSHHKMYHVIGQYCPCAHQCCCGTRENVSYGPNPFAAEIYDDHTDVWMCQECRYESAMDI